MALFISTQPIPTLKQIQEAIMTATQDTIDAITAQLGKAKTEILTQIANLEQQVAAGETPNLEPLKAVTQALDDITPDQPTE